jgi:hypothetical protein
MLRSLAIRPHGSLPCQGSRDSKKRVHLPRSKMLFPMRRQKCDAALSLLAERQDEAAAHVLVDCALRADPDHPVHRALSRPGTARISAILQRLKGADDRIAPVLVAALSRMRIAAATVGLFDALSLANPAARAAAATALVAANAEGARSAVSVLAKNDPDPEVRRVCSAALGSG